MEHEKLNHGLWEGVLKEIYDSGTREIALTVHPTYECSSVSTDIRENYIEKNSKFLQECRNRKIPIINLFSDNYEILLIDNFGRVLIYEATSGCLNCFDKVCNQKPKSLEEMFGVKADYEIPTFKNSGLPADTKLAREYSDFISMYDIYLPHSDSVFKSAIVTGTYSNRCHYVASSVIAPHTERLVVIPSCTLGRKGEKLDAKKYKKIVTQGMKFPCFMEIDEFFGEEDIFY